MVNPRPLAVAAGLAADRLLGEPPTPWHPVAWFGTVMSAVEQRGYAAQRLHGAGYAAVGVLTGIGTGVTLNRALLHPDLATFGATTVAVAGRALGEAAAAVGQRRQH